MFQEEPPPEAPIEGVRRWHGIDLLAGAGLLALGYLAVLALAVLLVHGQVAREREPGIAFALAGATLLSEVWIGVVVVLLARRRGIALRDLGLHRPRSWGLVAFAVLGAYAAVLAYSLLIAAAEAVTGADLSGISKGN